jgi:hypothetical protein
MKLLCTAVFSLKEKDRKKGGKEGEAENRKKN